MRALFHSSHTGSCQTSAVGSTAVPLGDRDANEVTIINRSGTSIDVKTANSSVFVPIADGAAVTLGLAANLAEVQLKRTDESNTQVVVHFISARYF
jgi:hypothetical protein